MAEKTQSKKIEKTDFSIKFINNRVSCFDGAILYLWKIKNSPDNKGRGKPKCFHNGIILIVICIKLVLQNYKIKK